jgi:hypothetical protein
MMANYGTTADAGIPILFHTERPWLRVAECGRSAPCIK